MVFERDVYKRQNQKFLKRIDFLIGLRELQRGKRRVEMIDLYSTIPAAVKDRDLSCLLYTSIGHETDLCGSEYRGIGTRLKSE